MSGSRIKSTIKALKLFLQSLPHGCKFQVISFGSSYTYFLGQEKMQTYNDVILKNILHEFDSYSADYGGTEILQPIKSATRMSNEGYKKRIFLLTDGDVSSPQKVIQHIE